MKRGDIDHIFAIMETEAAVKGDSAALSDW